MRSKLEDNDMIYEFKSRRTGTVTMTSDVAERLLEIIGKTPTPAGVITVEQIPAAVEAMQRAVRHETPPPSQGGDADEDADPNAYVSLGQRTYPLIDMLKEAHAKGVDVTWGV